MVELRAPQVALVVRNPPVNARDVRDTGSIPGSGRSPGGGHGNPLRCSCLENPMDRGAWQFTVHGAAEWDTTETTAHTHFPVKDLPLSFQSGCLEAWESRGEQRAWTPETRHGEERFCCGVLCAPLNTLFTPALPSQLLRHHTIGLSSRCLLPAGKMVFICRFPCCLSHPPQYPKYNLHERKHLTIWFSAVSLAPRKVSGT